MNINLWKFPKKSKMSNIVAEEYASSLSDLVANSKPLINMLTMLAEENIDHAPAIVQAVEKHLQKVRSDIKLPVLYLIDSIVKNVGQSYTSLFTQNIVSTFCSVFEKVDERTRSQMFKLRQTWNDVFPAKKLYAMDVRVSSIDPAWPITAPVPTTSIHLNPNFFMKPPVPTMTVATASTSTAAAQAVPVDDPQAIAEAKMREQLLKKQKKLLELQQKKLELELLQTKAKLDEQQKQLDRQTDNFQVQQQLLIPTLQALGHQDTSKVFTAPKHEVATPFTAVKSEASVPVAKTMLVPPAAIPMQATPSSLPAASSSSGGSRSPNKHRTEAKSRSTVKSVTSVTSVRSRDPRLASRQTVPPQPNVTTDHAHVTPPAPIQENTNTVFESVKLETAKPKPHITINIANKGNVNKETQGVSKKDPRLIRNKVHVSNSKERTTGSTGSGGADKVVIKSRGPSPTSPSRSGKSVPSLRKSNSKGNNATNCKTPSTRILSTSIIDLTDSPPHKVADKKETDVPSSKEKESHMEAVSKSSPSKLDNHKKKSAVSSNSITSSSSSRQLPPEKKKGSGKSNEFIGGSSSKRGKSIIGGNKNFRERSSSKKYDLFEVEMDSPSPPPPPVISENKKKEDTAFKDVKVSKKGRNYVRRNRESRSPEPPLVATGDVDLRHGAPPEKHPRLTAFQPDKEPVTSATEEETKKTLVDAATKDVDLRQLPRSPCKKRPSMERNEQPPNKKTKAEMIDVLFGNEDVDLRQLAPMPVATQSSLPPSPPPPPIISQPSPTPTTTSSQDSSTNTLSSPKQASLDREREGSGECSVEVTKPTGDDRIKENGDGKIFPRGWEKYKESKPDIYKSPFRSHELPKSQDSTPGSNSPIRDVPYSLSRERGVSQLNRRALGIGSRLEFDGLGRPLLYHRLPADPGERRLSLSVSSPLGEDTDMRPHLVDSEGVEHVDLSMNVIIAQAEEQLRNGSMTWAQYNTLLHQVIQLNEIHKLREAQRRDEQENNKENWDRSHSRRSELGKSSPRSQEGDSRGNSPAGTRYGDIDERFPVLTVHNTTPAAVPSPEPQPPGTNNLPSGPAQPWNDMGSHLPRPGLWDQPPHPWMRGGPVPPGPLPPPHIRMLPFHRQPGPGQEFPNNFGPMNRWRPPQFPNRAPFEGDLENRFDRFGMRFPRTPGSQLQQQQQQQQQPPPPSQQQPPPSQSHPQPVLQPHPQPPAQPQAQPAQPQQASNCELPPADPMLLDLISQDTMRTINIDGIPREIRYYGDAAIVMLAWDDPREIGFQGGSRRVLFDDRETVLCAFNDTYRDIVLDGTTHRIRLGAPTRELYIDGKWYECFFGGPPITTEIGGKLRMVKLEGPPPQVKIGFVKRTDLVAGKINLIINARTMVPIFLDAKPQRFDIEGKPHVLRFTHALSNVVINGRSFQVEFGGLPKPIVVREKKHFIRFSVLPRGVRPGYINIVNMEGGRLPSPPRQENENSDSMGFSPATSVTEELSDEAKYRKGHEPALPMLGPGGRGRGQRRTFSTDRDSPQDTDQARSSPGQFHNENAVMAPAGSVQQNQSRSRPTTQLPLEMLTSLMPVSMAPSSGFSYQVEQDSQDGQTKPSSDAPSTTASTTTEAVEAPANAKAAAGAVGSIPFLLPDINVDELYKKLVASGIVPQTETAALEDKKEDETNTIKPVDFNQPETLKVRQPGLVAALYSGIQCSSCGVRFPPEQTMKYSQHLDWHFRQNRRDRDNTRKAQSRKWYYDISDWIQFEEIEDLEERAQSWFETQQAAEGRAEEKEPVEIPSVSAGENAEDTFCDVCHDKFEQFYNEEREEWHLRYAIRVEGKTYHPLCYEDHKASLEVAVDESAIVEEPQEEELKSDSEKTEETPKSEDVEMKTETEEVKAEPEPASTTDTVKEEEMETKDDATVDLKTEPTLKEEPDAVDEVQATLNNIKLSQDDTLKEEVKTDETVESVKAEPVEVEEEVAADIAPVVDTTHTAVACSIDGNVKFEDKPQLAITAPIGGKIKINITKPLPVVKETQSESEVETSPTTEGETGPESKPAEGPSETGESAPEKVPEREIMEPPPPGVEPMYVKPRLVGRKLVDMPPVIKGTELSGLCSIM